MKKSIILINVLFLIFTTSIMAQKTANDYEKEWNKVTQFEDDDLPQSAAKEVNAILKSAMAKKNTQQVIKALLHKNKYKVAINNDDDTAIFGELQDLLKKTNNAGEKALLNSLLSEFYYEYYNNDRWVIDSRTNLEDQIPADIKEWTTSTFLNAIVSHLDASLIDSEALKKETPDKYEVIMELGKDSRELYPTLYDFVMKRSIYIAIVMPMADNGYNNLEKTGYTLDQVAIPAAEFIKQNIGKDSKSLALFLYKEYFVSLLERNMVPTTILTELSKNTYLASISTKYGQELSKDLLVKLEQKYENYDTSIEISDAIISSDTDYSNTERLTDIYDRCVDGINKYPNYSRINILKKRLASLKFPVLRINAEELYYPNKDISIKVLHRNLQVLREYPFLALYKVDGKDSILVKDIPISFNSEKVYISETDSINIGSFEAGKYSLTYKGIMPKSTNNEEYALESQIDFTISRLATFARNNNKKAYEVYVVDRIEGKPIENAEVKLYNEELEKGEYVPKLLASLKTDKNGLVTFNNVEGLNDPKTYFQGYYTVAWNNEKELTKQTITENYQYQYSSHQSNENKVEHSISTFSDRSIYRPGQTVFFKSIVSDRNDKSVNKTKVEAKLLNQNGEIISKQDLTTNEFGSVAGEFILPQSGLLGNYYLEMETNEVQNSHYFRVEEYKRPTFQITFDKVTDTYTFGEEIVVKGYAKNFSGISLQDANVNYSINGRKFSFWGWGGEETFSETGDVQTNADGSFEIKFVPKASDSAPSFFRSDVQTYSINAIVTDMNNETQSGNTSLVVANVSMLINIKTETQIEKSATSKMEIATTNLNGETIESKGKYSIFTLNKENVTIKEVLTGTFKTGEQPELRKQLNKLASGKYRVQVRALDNKNREVVDSTDVILYSYKDKKPPIETNEWFVEKNTTFSPDKKAEILFGVSAKDMNILYQIYSNKTIFERQRITLSEANKMLSIPYKAEYGDQAFLILTYVKEGVFYNKNILLQKESVKENKTLDIKMEVFRDKLRPGQEETWTISIKDGGNPISAEVLASMYDVSLDKIYGSDSWYLNRAEKELDIQPINYQYSNAYYSYYTNRFRQINLPYQAEGLSSVQYYFDELNMFDFSFRRYYTASLNYEPAPYPSSMVKMREANSVAEAVSGKVAGVAVTDAELGSGMMDDKFVLNESSVVAFTPPIISGASQEVQIRRNFNETAFFYPQLKTNEKGETLISFTVPESNTTWRFRALAHDEHLRMGQLEQVVITRKELMVTPNIPRFVRQGDKTSISAKVSNLSENTLSGDVRIEFFDPITDNIIDLKVANQSQTFTLDKDASSSASWTFDIPTEMELIGCRIVAASETFSDGEQHVLSVLPNRMLVTESMAIDVNKEGETVFTFDKLKNNSSASADNYRLTLEFSSNPAWYAVQALPTLKTPDNNNSVNWFASYYVNTLGASIMKQYPKIANMIAAWKKQGNTKETLISKLSKDEELKAVLLAETPWVLDAKTETEQMERLSLLFDLNNTNMATQTATSKLAELQTTSGGWAWIKDMNQNRAITQYILYGYAKLQLVGQVEYPNEVKVMQMNAIKYIDNEILREYKQLQKNDKKWKELKGISTNQLEYLYVRTFYRDIPIDIETREAERFYTSVVSKYWKSLNLYQRSLLINILESNGNKTLANSIAKTIRERSVTDPKMGMYWPNNRSHAFISMSGVSVHTFLMDALRKNGASEQEMNLMKQWLIKQKQTQIWESTHATMDAITALLNSGSDWFGGEDTNTSIKVGAKTIDTGSQEIGTGYVKTSWYKSEIKKEMGEVRISRKSTQPAYGALYWQYYEDLSKITEHKGDLNVDKQLFKEVESGKGKSLTSITSNNRLKVGDKVIVRLTVRVNSDMEFVHLKDMRASCFEPSDTKSGLKWQDKAYFYQETRDASTNLFFDRLPKGTYVFEYPVHVNRTGEYANGITSIQCLYAPEYVSHTNGITVVVE